MQQAFNTANEQIQQILRGNQSYNLPMVLAELNEKLVSRIGGWVEIQYPIHHRYVMNPGLLYSDVDPMTKVELSGLLDTIQFNFDGIWYCFEKAATPNDDMWGIGFGDLIEYITYRVKYSVKWQDCRGCDVDPDLCIVHRRGLISFTPGKELKELLTHDSWCNTIMTIMRNNSSSQ